MEISFTTDELDLIVSLLNNLNISVVNPEALRIVESAQSIQSKINKLRQVKKDNK